MLEAESEDEETKHLTRETFISSIQHSLDQKNKARCMPVEEGGKPFIKVRLTPIASAPGLKNSEFHVNESHKLAKLVKYLKKELKADFKIHCNQFVPSPDMTFGDLAGVSSPSDKCVELRSQPGRALLVVLRARGMGLNYYYKCKPETTPRTPTLCLGVR